MDEACLLASGVLWTLGEESGVMFVFWREVFLYSW